jgi:hypothetical protein
VRRYPDGKINLQTLAPPMIHAPMFA